MKKNVSLLIFVTCLVFACAPSPDNPDKKPLAKKETAKSKPAAKKDSEGKKLYKKYCMLCHGSDGKRGTNGAYDLTVSKLTFNQKVEIVKKGRGVMTPFEFLGEEKIKTVVEYLETLK